MWCLPSYGRPEQAQRTLDSMVSCGAVAPGVLFLNRDDPALPRYEGIRLPAGWTVHVLKAGSFSADAYRAMFRRHPDAPWYGVIPDDVVAESWGFEEALVGAAGATAIAYANDGWQFPRRMHGAIVFGGDLVRAWGWLAPDGFRHMFVDDVWEFFGRELKLARPLAHVSTPHLHPGCRKAEPDATYERSGATWEHDKARWESWWEHERMDAFRRVAAVTGQKFREVELAGKSVAIATPMAGGQAVQAYVRSLAFTITACHQAQVGYWLLTIGDESMVHKARNQLARMFLEQTTASHLLFVDADMGWRPDHVLRLLAHEKDVVGAAGCRKAFPLSWCYRPLHPVAPMCQETGCMEAEAVGTGFLLISRAALEQMKPHVPVYRNTDGLDYHAFFHPTVRRHEDGTAYQWSEDYQFCIDWREKCGGRIWVDPEIGLEHVGQHAWAGALRDELARMQAEHQRAKEQGHAAQEGQQPEGHLGQHPRRDQGREAA